MSGTALYDSDGNFIGHSIGVQHHTAGTRAWCLEGMISEWCYPSSPCDSCQRARMGDPWEAIQRVQAVCDKPNRGPSWDPYVEGYNDALGMVERALDGGAE